MPENKENNQSVSSVSSVSPTVTPIPEIPTVPPVPPQGIFQFFHRGYGKWLALAAIILINVAIFGVWILLKDEPSTPTKKTSEAKSGSEKEIAAVTPSFAKVGDSFTAQIPTVGGDKQIMTTATVKRIVKLLPKSDKSTVDFKFCNQLDGCQPFQPIPVDEGRALVVLDLELYNPSTALDVAGENSAYMQAQYFRFKVGEEYESVRILSRNITTNAWFEQEPTLYVAPAKKTTMTFFVRVPEETTQVDFLYGSNLQSPLVLIPMSFASVVPSDPVAEVDLSEGGSAPVSSRLESFVKTIRQGLKNSVRADSHYAISERFRTGQPFICTFDVNSSQVEGAITQGRLMVDGKKYRLENTFEKDKTSVTVSDIFDGQHEFAATSIRSPGTSMESVLIALDVPCLEKQGIYTPVPDLMFSDVPKNVVCRWLTEPTNFTPTNIDDNVIYSVAKGNC